MLRCEEVTRLHASEELARAGWRTRLAARIHLMMCRSCARYVRELAVIGDAVRGAARDASDGPERLESIVRKVLPTEEPPRD